MIYGMWAWLSLRGVVSVLGFAGVSWWLLDGGVALRQGAWLLAVGVVFRHGLAAGLGAWPMGLGVVYESGRGQARESHGGVACMKGGVVIILAGVSYDYGRGLRVRPHMGYSGGVACGLGGVSFELWAWPLRTGAGCWASGRGAGAAGRGVGVAWAWQGVS